MKLNGLKIKIFLQVGGLNNEIRPTVGFSGQ